MILHLPLLVDRSLEACHPGRGKIIASDIKHTQKKFSLLGRGGENNKNQNNQLCLVLIVYGQMNTGIIASIAATVGNAYSNYRFSLQAINITCWHKQNAD